MKLFVFIVLVILILCFQQGVLAKSGRNISASLMVKDQRRSYTVHVPDYPTTDLPLVIVLHGFLSGRKYVAWDTEMSKYSDKRHFVVAYPQGVGASWNAGTCCGKAYLHDVDDVSFIKVLIDDLIEKYHLNARMVYVTGFSNGAMMCYRLGSELSAKIAAIAPVEGNMQLKLEKPSEPVSVLVVHGKNDHVFPSQGGTGKWLFERFDTVSVQDIAKFWVEADGCNTDAQETLSVGFSRRLYAAGKSGSEVCVIEITAGGHFWPQGQEARVLRHKGKDFNTTLEVCDFFFKHAKP